MTPLVDEMKEPDLDAVLDIDVDAFHEPREVRERQLREELVRPWAHLRVARGELESVVGYLLFWHVVDEVHVINVAVAPRERRKGVGRLLVEDLLTYARERRVAKILLEVRASNAAAIGLYEGAGFERFNVRSRYYSDGEDAVEMMLTFPV